MKKKFLLIGKKSFITSNIKLFLKKTYDLKIINYKNFSMFSDKKLSKFDILMNCSINESYVQKKYSVKNDFDFNIAKKIKNLPIKVIFLSSRKVYKIGNNLKEDSKLYPKCNYSKNKLNSERKLSKILKSRLLIFRISNLIGPVNKKNSKNKIHKTFIETFFQNINKNIIFDNENIYKDFIDIQKFCLIIKKSIKLNLRGVFNVSIGEKIYLNELVNWLNFYNKKKTMTRKLPVNFNKDSFYLNNNKIKKKLKINISKNHLKNYCFNISKNFFQNKN